MPWPRCQIKSSYPEEDGSVNHLDFYMIFHFTRPAPVCSHNSTVSTQGKETAQKIVTAMNPDISGILPGCPSSTPPAERQPLSPPLKMLSFCHEERHQFEITQRI